MSNMKKRSRDDTDEDSGREKSYETQAVIKPPLVNLGKRTREDQPERRVAPSQQLGTQ